MLYPSYDSRVALAQDHHDQDTHLVEPHQLLYATLAVIPSQSTITAGILSMWVLPLLIQPEQTFVT